MAIRTVRRETWERKRKGVTEGNLTTEQARDDLASFLYRERLLPTVTWRRTYWEPVWIACWENFRGTKTIRKWFDAEADPEEGRSDITVGATKRKVMAAVNRALDIGLPAGERPWMLKPTPVPQGLRKKHVDKLLAMPGMEEMVLNGLASEPGTTARAKLEASISKDVDEMAQEGLERATAEVADIWDEGQFADVLADGMLMKAIMGTSIIKGPFEMQRPVVSFTNGKRKVSYRDSLDIEQLDLFSYLVDRYATGTGPEKASFEAYADTKTEAEIRAIAEQWEWDDDQLDRALNQTRPPEQRVTLLGDKQLRDESTPSGEADGSQEIGYEYVEFYGLVPVEHAAAFEHWPDDLPEESAIEGSGAVEAIVQIVNGVCPHAIINDQVPLARPFHVDVQQRIPGSPYGFGIGEDMLDLHEMTDSAYRLYIDNKALVGNPPVAVDDTMITEGYEDSIEMEMGAIWHMKGDPGKAMKAVQIPDVSASLKDLIETLENLGDEKSGINRYTSGDPSQSLNQTARGISILTSRADLSIRGALKNFDRNHVRPIVTAIYHWVREHRNLPIETDYDVVAAGSSSVMAREQQVQQLTQYASIFAATMQPAEAVYLKRKIYKLLGFDDVDKFLPEVPDGPQPGAMASPGNPAGGVLAGPGGVAGAPGGQGPGPAPQPGVQPPGVAQGDAGNGQGVATTTS